MALVKRQQSPRPASPGDDDCVEIGQPSVNVLVSTLEVQNQPVILRLEPGDGESSHCEVIQERKLRSAAEPAAEQVVDFSGDGGRNDEFPGLIASAGMEAASLDCSPARL